jgi:hypothetical protein
MPAENHTPSDDISARRRELGHHDGRDLARNALKHISLPEFTEHNVNRFLYQSRLVSLVADVPGDVVECGVGKGRSLLLWAHALYRERRDRDLWAFDSFEGFPEPTPEDDSPRRSRKGEWAVCTLPEIQDRLLASGLPAEWLRARVTIVRGYFDESLHKHTGESIALLYIDADLYSSYISVFEQLADKVASGGVIAFDEYMGTWEHYPFPGAKQAIDEYLARTGWELRRDREFGKYYVVKPRHGQVPA